MGRVCLLAPSLSSADAMGTDVGGMHRALTARGIETHAFAEHWTPDLPFTARPFAGYARYAQAADTVTIYHLTTSWQRGAQQFLDSRGPKVLRYHNITPAHFFAPYSAAMARACREGRRETAALVTSGRLALLLADSAFNRDELVCLGAPLERCVIVPPLHAVETLCETPATVTLLERFLDGALNVLFVGRVVPNKGHRHLLGVLAAYRRLFSRPLRLIVGGEQQPYCATYHEELRWLARGLRVADAVVWTGRVSAADLRAYFLLAHAFLIMSEHEGFCVPAVEAMAQSVPVVAHDAGAVAETLGGAGIVLDGLDYDQYAAALELIVTRPAVRDALIARGRQRARTTFDRSHLAQQILAAICPLLGDAAPIGAAGSAPLA